ncbi:MAG: universal stress protein [Xanthomonadaceae bacterium]|jgi:nucleotide-binding universal stress UspA family protein|nr:universal stress protein [Xanthomonadaceae bacterium]
MTTPMKEMKEKPTAILLATDLSGRCDRTQDRAIALARQWRARLVAVTVVPGERERQVYDQILDPIPWANQQTAAQLAEKRLRQGLAAADEDLAITLRVETGNIGDAVLRVAAEENCQLIVTGVARNEMFQPVALGSTVSMLVRQAPQPVLIVHNRPRRPYYRLAMATDFSAAARNALEETVRLFDEPLTVALIHGLDVPQVGLTVMDANRGSLIDQAREAASQQARKMLAEADIPAPIRDQITVVIEEGDPVRLLRDYLRDHESDLLAIGSKGRSALYDILLGSTANRILELVQIDTLVVPAPAQQGKAPA